MKQGIVMEIKNRKAIVLTKDGSFERVSLKKSQHVEIGSEIDVPVAKSFLSPRTQRFAISIAAVAAVLLLFFTQYPLLKQSNLAVAAYISLDINPSLEVGVNDNLNVVEVIPINDDGQKIVDQIQDDYFNKSLSEFIDDTVDLAKEEGYLNENNDVLLTTTTINKKAESKIEENLNKIKKEIESDGVAVTTLKGDEIVRKEAKDLGVSTGKYMIYKESKESLSIEEAKDLSVTEIYEKLEKNQNKKFKEEKIDKQINKKEQKNDNKKDKNVKEENAPAETGNVKVNGNKNKNQESDIMKGQSSKNQKDNAEKQYGKSQKPDKDNDAKEKNNKNQQENNGKDNNKNKQNYKYNGSNNDN